MTSSSGRIVADMPLPTVESRVLELYAGEGRRLFAFVLGLVGSRPDAEDVVQECFVRLATHLRAGGDDRHLKGWLYRVAKNAVHDLHRHRLAPRALPDEPAAAPLPLTRLAFERALASLSARDRELVLLRGLGHSYAEMAAMVGLEPASVGKTLARAVERFGIAFETQTGSKESP